MNWQPTSSHFQFLRCFRFVTYKAENSNYCSLHRIFSSKRILSVRNRFRCGCHCVFTAVCTVINGHISHFASQKHGIRVSLCKLLKLRQILINFASLTRPHCQNSTWFSLSTCKVNTVSFCAVVAVWHKKENLLYSVASFMWPWRTVETGVGLISINWCDFHSTVFSPSALRCFLICRSGRSQHLSFFWTRSSVVLGFRWGKTSLVPFLLLLHVCRLLRCQMAIPPEAGIALSV